MANHCFSGSDTRLNSTLILFDIDGTLLTADRSGRVAFELALAELFGLEGLSYGITFAGKTDWQILLDLLLPRGFSQADVAQAMPDFAEMLARKLAAIIGGHKVRPLPGARELIEALRDEPRARLGLVTGNVGASVPVKLRAAGFDPADFPIGAFGHESANRSDLPPLAVRRARAHWREDFPPERIVIVGDTPNDVICTRSVGGRALAVLNGMGTREALATEEPYAILDDLTDLAVVRNILFMEAQDDGRSQQA